MTEEARFDNVIEVDQETFIKCVVIIGSSNVQQDFFRWCSAHDCSVWAFYIVYKDFPFTGSFCNCLYSYVMIKRVKQWKYRFFVFFQLLE